MHTETRLFKTQMVREVTGQFNTILHRKNEDLGRHKTKI